MMTSTTLHLRTLPAFTALCAAAALTLPAAAQDASWAHPDGTTHTYRVVQVPATITWQAANAAAARAGGYLATITSLAENIAVYNLILDAANWTKDPNLNAWNGPWIGGVQSVGALEPAGGWAWSELEGSSYQGWTTGQPDDNGGTGVGNANRMHFGGAANFPVGSWADAPADTALSSYVIEFSGPTVPRTVGTLQQDRGASAGYTLISPMNTTDTHLVDPRGRVVRTWVSKYQPGQSAYLLPNGNLLRCGKVGNTPAPSGGDGGIIEEFDWDNNLVWSYFLSSTTELLHHDIARLPNGNTLMVVWDYKTAQQAIDAGRDPASLKSGHLWPDKIIEVQPTGKTTGTIVWQWHPFDHLVQDFDSTKANFGDPAKHPELIDINYTPDGIGDWMHSNAIDYHEGLDQIILSVRSFDEFWVIDHSTSTQEAAGHSGGRSGRGGDLLYRWGNPMTYRRGTLADRRLFKQHDAHWIPDGLPGAGHVLVFNNGIGRPGGDYSSVEELGLPQVDANGNYPMTGSTWGPTASLWTYQAATPASFMSTYVSGSQRLANGNTLVCAGWIGRTREVDRNSNTVWEYVNPAAASGVATQGDPTAPAQRGLFRAPHYAPDYAAFKGRNLVAGAPLEAHPAVLLADGSTLPHIKRVGTSVELSLRASHLPGQIYLVGTSATDGLIPVDRRFARMGADIVLQASLFGHAPATFRRYFGLLDGSGQATAAIAVPAIPDLKGLLLYTTMFVHHPLAPNSIGMISNTVVVEIDT